METLSKMNFSTFLFVMIPLLMRTNIYFNHDSAETRFEVNVIQNFNDIINTKPNFSLSNLHYLASS